MTNAILLQLQDMKGQLRCREQRALELQVESDQLREQAARQSSVIASLRKRVQVRAAPRRRFEDRGRSIEARLRSQHYHVCRMEHAQ